MNELSHQNVQRLVHRGQYSSAERLALTSHLRSCAACRRYSAVDSALRGSLILDKPRTRPSPQFTTVYLESAARRSRRSHIMKPIYAVGGAAALALLMLAGWFIIKSNIQTTGLVDAPQLPAISVSEPLVEEQPVKPEAIKSQPEVAEPPSEIDAAVLNEDLIAAVQAGDAAEVGRLVEAGANPDAQASQGNAVLALAARDGQLETVQHLNQTEAVSILIEHGASLDLKNNKGQTALDVAKNETIANLLRDAGAGE